MRLALVAAACVMAAACGGADDETAEQRTRPVADTASQADAPAASVVLVDTAQPPAVAGDAGWGYHLRANADLDGDGQPERASLIARVGGGDDGFLWDDGQPWQLYVEEADGTRTYVYRRWVQLGTVEAHVASRAPGEKGLDLLIVENTPGDLRVYEVRYAGPGRVTSVERLARRILPEQGFSAAHP
ncbi:MAG TPA: hypothetical protein VLK84_18915 [Longimicrobium sp.]|nr:hypothetical protein [Longimicrobium sp.]